MKKQILILILFFNSYSYSSPFLDRCRTTVKALNVAVGVAQLYRKVRHIEPVGENGSLKHFLHKAWPVSSTEEAGVNGVSSSVLVQIEMTFSAVKMGRKRGSKILKKMLETELHHEVLKAVIQAAGELGGPEGAEVMDKVFEQNLLFIDAESTEMASQTEN